MAAAQWDGFLRDLYRGATARNHAVKRGGISGMVRTV